ncbi:MAG: hypothetical protein OK452_08285 [Thaumarchaeota archaeon]|nr:hypothetical protein [Nitrososphaerota archaeon]
MNAQNIHQKKRTAVKTFRLPEDVLDFLEKEAEDEGTTLNALVSSILIRHSEWGSMARKLGMISVSKSLLQAALESSRDEELVATSRKILPQGWKDMAMFKFHDFSLESMIQLFKLLTKYGYEADMDVNRVGNKYMISFRHALGPKFSLLLKNAIDELLRVSFHIQPTIETSDASVAVTFSAP